MLDLPLDYKVGRGVGIFLIGPTPVGASVTQGGTCDPGPRVGK